MIKGLKRLWLGAAEEAPADSPHITRVLMVCTANICRSPTAEAVLRAKLQRAGLHQQVVVDSAGTQGFHLAEAPDLRAQRAAALRGYDLSPLRARRMTPDDFFQHHHILAMDTTHLAWLQKRAPEGSAARLRLLMDHAPQFPDQAEVPDPYYGGPAGFERVLDLIEDACDGWLAQLQPPQSPKAAPSAEKRPAGDAIRRLDL